MALSGFHVSPAIEGQLDVVAASVQLGQHPADVVARIAFDFQDERGRYRERRDCDSPSSLRGVGGANGRPRGAA